MEDRTPATNSGNELGRHRQRFFVLPDAILPDAIFFLYQHRANT